MKELSIEEKARRYDKAIERAIVWRKKYVNFTISEDGIMLRDFDNIFPELKESEGERTWIINYLSNRILNSTIIAEKENLKKAISWLEAQGEQKPAEEYNITGIGSKNAQGKLGEMIKRKLKMEKQGEQKPAEYEKPLLEKFKQAVYDCAWGKVTCKKEGETKEEYANRWAEHFLLMVRDWADDYIDFTIQQKLRNSYEKGKADIIEQKPAWSEEDEKILSDIIKDLVHPWNEYIPDRIEYEIKWLKNRLKSLKDRVQPKQGWSEEDCNQIETIACHLDNIGNGAMAELLLNIMDKYKSLRHQTTWKPSDEQIEALVSAIDVMIDNRGAGDKNTILLSGLYHELKTL